MTSADPPDGNVDNLEPAISAQLFPSTSALQERLLSIYLCTDRRQSATSSHRSLYEWAEFPDTGRHRQRVCGKTQTAGHVATTKPRGKDVEPRILPGRQPGCR